MTLDEAIEHARQVANTCDNSECAANHMQLAEWLRRARGADKAARWYTNRIQKLETENAKLRELIADVHEALCADKAGMFHKLILASMEDDMRELGVEVEG